jgi:hypothetical protein
MRSDSYYIQLANKILHALMHEKLLKTDSGVLVSIAVRMAAYFEDVVSRTGLFSACRKINMKELGRKLPFFEFDGREHDEDYFDDEINDADIRFLLWCTIQEALNEQDSKVHFLNPDNELIFTVGRRIADVLYEEYETAPENTELYEFVHEVDFNDFMAVRDVLQWLHYSSYLSMNYPLNNLEKEFEWLFSREKKWDERTFNALSYEIDVMSIFCKTCTPLALRAVELLKEMTAVPGAAEKLEALKIQNMTGYRVLEITDSTVKVSPLDRPAEVLEIDRNSFDTGVKLERDMLLMSVLIFFNGLWQVNGFAIIGTAHEQYIVAKQDLYKRDAQENEGIEHICDSILKYFGNSPLMFFKNFSDYVEFWTRIFPDAQTPYHQNDLYKRYRNGKDLLFFVDRKHGIALLPDAARWVKLPDNPLYSEKDATNCALALLVGSMPAPLSLISYLLENGLIPDAAMEIPSNPERARQIVRENGWFIVRFFQPHLFNQRLFLND